jgi:hypothetical protein
MGKKGKNLMRTYKLKVNNLALLAQYLFNLPDDYKFFDMGRFSKTNQNVWQVDTDADLINCGTAGCAIGHAPFVKGIVTDRPVCDYGALDVLNNSAGWLEYAEDVSGVDAGERTWEYMFGGSWDWHDNTAYGAAQRILYILAGNRVPVEEDEDYDDLVYDERIYENYGPSDVTQYLTNAVEEESQGEIHA